MNGKTLVHQQYSQCNQKDEAACKMICKQLAMTITYKLH